MERKRKRLAKELKEKGIPVAEAGQEVVWNDAFLKVPFISNPFITRLKGRAELNQALAYNLYFDDLEKKWKPLSDITISTVKNLGRYYTGDPTPPEVQSDLHMRITNKHELRTKDTDLATLIQTLIDMY